MADPSAIRVDYLAEEPIPVIAVEWAGGHDVRGLVDFLERMEDRLLELVDPGFGFAYRRAETDDLRRVLSVGVDVEPEDAVLRVARDPSVVLADGLDDTDVLLLVLDQRRLEPTRRRLTDEMDDAERADLRKTYPTTIKSDGGDDVWVSRLAEDDPRLGSEEEMLHSGWIPGDPRDALAYVLLIGPSLAVLRRRWQAATSDA